MMEVLQTSVGRAQQWSTRRSCAAQSKVLGWLGVGSYPGVMSRGEASCRQCVGRLVLGWARTSVLRRAVARTATRSDRIGRPSRSRTPPRTSCRSLPEGRAVSHAPSCRVAEALALDGTVQATTSPRLSGGRSDAALWPRTQLSGTFRPRSPACARTCLSLIHISEPTRPY